MPSMIETIKLLMAELVALQVSILF